MIEEALKNVSECIQNYEKKIKELEEENRELQGRIFKLEMSNHVLEHASEEFEKFIENHIPVRVYVHKQRRNTTIVFKDNSTETVKRMKGDKDCLDTAIAYALVKHSYKKSELNELKKHVQEVGE